MVTVKPASLLVGGSENLSEICVALVCEKPCEWVWYYFETGTSGVFVSVGMNQRGRIELEDWKTLVCYVQREKSDYLCPVGLQEDLESFYGGGVKQRRVEYVFFLDYCHDSVSGIERGDVWPQERVTLYAWPRVREMLCFWTQVKETLYA